MTGAWKRAQPRPKLWPSRILLKPRDGYRFTRPTGSTTTRCATGTLTTAGFSNDTPGKRQSARRCLGGAHASAEWETVGTERPANCFAQDPFNSRPQGILTMGASRLCRKPASFIPRQSNARVSDRRQRESGSRIEPSVEAASCSLDAMVRPSPIDVSSMRMSEVTEQTPRLR